MPSPMPAARGYGISFGHPWMPVCKTLWTPSTAHTPGIRPSTPTAPSVMGVTAFITDTAPGVVAGQLAGLELRHRQHARVEDRIRN